MSGSSSATALPRAGFVALICDTGANDAYLNFGGAGVVATVAGGTWLKAGTCGAYDLKPFGTLLGYVAALTQSSTTTLYVETGAGSPPNPFSTSSGNQDVNLKQVGGAAIALGQTTKSASIPTTSASDPDSRPSSGSVTIRDTGSTTASGQNGATIITGTPTAASFQAQAVNGQSTARILVTGTWTGTLEFDGSIDGGTTWLPVPARVTSTGYTTSSITANGMFDTDSSGLTNVRARATAAMTGTATVLFTFSAVGGPVQVLNPAPQQLGLTPTDRTIASATGSSQQVMAANASRHSLTISNTGTGSCGINPTGGAAVIGGAGTLTLTPLGSYTPRVPPVGAVTAICTAGQPLYADEN